MRTAKRFAEDAYNRGVGDPRMLQGIINAATLKSQGSQAKRP
jgi:hypothetical protein